MNKTADIVVREKTVKCKRDKEVMEPGIDTTRTSSYFAKEKQFYMKSVNAMDHAYRVSPKDRLSAEVVAIISDY